MEHAKGKTFYIPIPQNEKTQRQVQAILVLEKLKKDFESMDDKDKESLMHLMGE